MTVTYSASSLADIADRFERIAADYQDRSRKAKKNSDQQLNTVAAQTPMGISWTKQLPKSECCARLCDYILTPAP